MPPSALESVIKLTKPSEPPVQSVSAKINPRKAPMIEPLVAPAEMRCVQGTVDFFSIASTWRAFQITPIPTNHPTRLEIADPMAADCKSAAPGHNKQAIAVPRKPNT